MKEVRLTLPKALALANLKRAERGQKAINSCGTDMLLNQGTNLFTTSNQVELFIPIAITAPDDDLAQCL